MRLSIKTTFDFGKLANKIKSITDETVNILAKQYEKASLSNINKRIGNTGGKLKKNAKVTILKKGHDRVLIDKEFLLSSIKASTNTLSMNDYGWRNHKGINRPERPFIGYGKGHPDYDSYSNSLMKVISKKIKEGLKK